MTALSRLNTTALLLMIILIFSPAGNNTLYGRVSDSLFVQTFTFDSLSTRRAEFEFPPAGKTWSKILMFYTLKCDSATTGDPYPCGEWDVNTYTRIYRHTGLYDSLKHTHPHFIVDGKSPDQFLYSENPRYDYFEKWSLGEEPMFPDEDHYLKFEGTDYLEIPVEAVRDLDSTFTISMWVKGDISVQPQNDNLFEAMDMGGRVLNVHLPWGTGTVYFDAGGRLSGNNNRLSKQADPGDYMGRWNHWAFTKDAGSGIQRIFLNGELWHEAGNMFKTIDTIDRFIIGANGNANGGFYAGSLDEVRIWDTVLDAETIAEWRFKPITRQHPQFTHLKVNYTFDHLQGDIIPDSSPNQFHAASSGQPQQIPFGRLSSSDLKPYAGSYIVLDSIPAPKVTVYFYGNAADPGVVTSIENVWPAYDSFYNAEGQLLSERPITNPQIFDNGEHIYYDPPEEVIDVIELGRFITPYGKGLNLGENGFTWIYDVTDYAPLLQGRVDLQAANDFELLDLKFVFIKGQAPREVLEIKNLWPGGDYQYTELAEDKKIQPIPLRLIDNAAGYKIRARISGHGHAGPYNCCEWDAKEHSISVNGIRRFNWKIWRDCGYNPVYPQGGTWQFDRAGWCPGTWVDTYDFDLSPYVQPGQEIVLDYGIEAPDLDTGEGDGRYYTEFQLISYGPVRQKYDTEITAILAPSTLDENGRLNPLSLQPIVEIRNLGSVTLTHLKITYGLISNTKAVFQWEGHLDFEQSETVVLPKPDWSGMDRPDARFSVTLSKPNGRRDKNRSNNTMITVVEAPVILPSEFVLYLELPGFERAVDNQVVIVSEAQDTVFFKNDFQDNEIFSRTIHLAEGAYEFTITDNNEDGLIRHWWLRGYDPDSIGENGSIQIRSVQDSLLMDLGYDFAEKENLQFFVGIPE